VEQKKVTDIKPGEFVVGQIRPGGTLSDAEVALNQIERIDQIKKEVGEMERPDLEKEFTRINSDFDLTMKNQDKLHAIMGVLVDKFGATSEDVKKLRERKV
jgi:hypothetical protein